MHSRWQVSQTPSWQVMSKWKVQYETSTICTWNPWECPQIQLCDSTWDTSTTWAWSRRVNWTTIMQNQIIQSFVKILLNIWFVKEVFELILGSVFYIFEAFVRLFIPRPKKDVEGEIALVTGAANGIGKLIAKELGQHGATLVLWDINSEALERTAKELHQALDVRVYAYTCDCSRRSEVYRVAELVKSSKRFFSFIRLFIQFLNYIERHILIISCTVNLFKIKDMFYRHLNVVWIFKQVKKEVGDVTILVNNAGVVTGKYTFTEAPDNLVDRTLRVNVAAHFWVILFLLFSVSLLLPPLLDVMGTACLLLSQMLTETFLNRPTRHFCRLWYNGIMGTWSVWRPMEGCLLWMALQVRRRVWKTYTLLIHNVRHLKIYY